MTTAAFISQRVHFDSNTSPASFNRASSSREWRGGIGLYVYSGVLTAYGSVSPSQPETNNAMHRKSRVRIFSPLAIGELENLKQARSHAPLAFRPVVCARASPTIGSRSAIAAALSRLFEGFLRPEPA